MPSKRTGYAPWSLTREAGVLSATVDGTIEVPQNVQPTLSTGFIDYRGNWQGAKSSDEQFIGFTTAVGIPNTGVVLFPNSANLDHIDMTGFEDLIIAFKPEGGGGTVNIKGVMGPDTVSFGNLSPVNAAATLRAAGNIFESGAKVFENALDDSEALTADVWNIYYIQGRLRNQKNLQIKMTNTDVGNTNFEFAFMRVVK